MVGTLELIGAVREALVGLLSQGSWDSIKADHQRVGLDWKPELNPGWGKPKYVRSVISGLAECELVGLAHRCMEQLTDRNRTSLQDALWWLAANGVAQITEITRRAIAKALDGRTMRCDEEPATFAARCSGVSRNWDSPSYAYDERGELCKREPDLLALFGVGSASPPRYTKLSHLELLGSYGLLEWPDERVMLFLEQLAHPVARASTAEQEDWVRWINELLVPDRFALVQTGFLSGRPVFGCKRHASGVPGRPKNIIFASAGPKPELGFSDAINNDIVVLKNEQHCLVYEDDITDSGVTWEALVAWWGRRQGTDGRDPLVRKALGQRLLSSIASPVERSLFLAYFRQFAGSLGSRLPALLPQVYLHYDPVSLRELQRRGEQRRFLSQRMDFLLLMPGQVRVVLEVDGQQHYSEGDSASARPSPSVYAMTVQADRELRLAGYEVYRFGGHELQDDRAARVVSEFFSALFRRHGIGS